jgi:hypothetical protein
MAMIQPRCAPSVVAAVVVCLTVFGGAADAQRNDEKKASLSLKATPTSGFAPLRVRMSVDVRGGAEDAQDFYCPSVEWDWGDDQKSTSSEDCDPYEPGKSTIRRRYSGEHRFTEGGTFNVRFRLKQGNRVVATTSVIISVREGLNDGFAN